MKVYKVVEFMGMSFDDIGTFADKYVAARVALRLNEIRRDEFDMFSVHEVAVVTDEAGVTEILECYEEDAEDED